MDRLAFLLVIFSSVTVGCSTVGFKQNPTIGVGVTGVESVVRPVAQMRQQIPAKADADCDAEVRAWWFVTHLPAVSEVYQLDLYLSQKNPNASEPKYIGRCIENPFIAKQEPTHE